VVDVTRCVVVTAHVTVRVMSLCCRATVIERRNMWFRDDGALTRVFCEDSKYTPTQLISPSHSGYTAHQSTNL